jgi:hypothetical protein
VRKKVREKGKRGRGRGLLTAFFIVWSERKTDKFLAVNGEQNREG